MTEYIDIIKKTQKNLEIMKNMNNQIKKNFQLFHNGYVSFFIFLHPINYFTKYKIDFEELINNYLKLNKKIKKIFIFIYNKEKTIELNDNYIIITTNNKPINFMNDFLLKVQNLEGLRYIASKLNISSVCDKRNKELLKNLPYLEYNDTNNVYKIYKNDFTERNNNIKKLEEYLLNDKKRLYFIYFKKNINEIEYIEKSMKHIILFYPEYKKDDLLELMKSI